MTVQKKPEKEKGTTPKATGQQQASRRLFSAGSVGEKVACLFALAAFVLFLFPIVQYETGGMRFEVSAWQILTAPGLVLGGQTAGFWWLARIAAALCLLMPLAGLVLLMLGKKGLAALCLLLGPVCSLVIAQPGSAIIEALGNQSDPEMLISYTPLYYIYWVLALVAALLAWRARGYARSAQGLKNVDMSDEAQRAHQRKKDLAKGIIAIVMGLVPAATFFMPYVTYSFNDTVYQVSAWQLLTAPGLEVNGAVVHFPLLAQISVVIGAVLPLAAIVLLLCKKAVWAGVGFLLSALTPLLVLLTSSSVQTALTGLNISQIVVAYQLPFTLTLVLGLCAAVLAVWTKGTEQLAQSIFLVFSCVSVGSVVILTVYMISAGAPAMAEIGLGNFLFGTTWKPGNDQYGILPFILSSIAGTFGAVLLGVPIGILTAVFLSETAPRRLASVVRPAVQLLAGIPSVVYGFFGMLVILPAIRAVFPGAIGESLLAVILILAIMVLPTIVSVSETALRAVPVSYREAALALGTTPVKTIFKVTIPAAKSGILAGVILGVGRAIGETMAVIMVAGNVANMPSLLGTVKLLTTGIAMEMSYSSGLHRQALFAIGLVLFVFIMIVNIAFTVISKKGVQMDAE